MACVLIVEDDEDSRHMLETLLASSAYDTMSAANGREALEHMRRRRPCLVLLDMMMPVMDGWQFRNEQLQDPALATVPVVCVTAYFTPREIEDKLGLRCIPKTAQFDSILPAVDKACRSGEREHFDRNAHT
jgi:CheY-like chemotaxis protein